MKKDREKWLQERTTGLGSTDAAAIVGLSPWKTPLHVQVEKLSKLPMEQEKELLSLGLRMEPVILGMYEDKTGHKPRRVNQIVRSKEHPFMIASLDAKRAGVDIEAKMCLFAQGRFGTEGTDEIPEHYLLQVQHQLAVTGFEIAEVPVFMYGKLKIYVVKRNEKLINTIIEKEKEFWEKHIIGQEVVEPDFEHALTLPLLKQIWGVDDSKPEVELPFEANILVADYQEYGEVIKTAEKLKKGVQARLIDMLQGAPAGRTPDGSIITQKLIENKGYTVKPFTKQDFRIHSPKGVQTYANTITSETKTNEITDTANGIADQTGSTEISGSQPIHTDGADSVQSKPETS